MQGWQLTEETQQVAKELLEQLRAKKKVLYKSECSLLNEVQSLDNKAWLEFSSSRISEFVDGAA